jgi:hypothetical protein
MAVDINGTTGLTFNNGSAQDVGGVGTGGQIWQNVASSRALNTSYTNSTGKPIMVNANIYLQGTGQGAAFLVVGGFTVAEIQQNTAGLQLGQASLLSAVVPRSATFGVALPI